MNQKESEQVFEGLLESQLPVGFDQRCLQLDEHNGKARLTLQELNQSFLYASLKVAITMQTARQIFESKMEREEAVETDWSSISKTYPIQVQKVIDLIANQLAQSLTQTRPSEILSWISLKLEPDFKKLRKGVKLSDLAHTFLSGLRIVAILTQSLISRESHAQLLDREARDSIDGISKTFINSISKIQKQKEKSYDPSK